MLIINKIGCDTYFTLSTDVSEIPFSVYYIDCETFRKVRMKNYDNYNDNGLCVLDVYNDIKFMTECNVAFLFKRVPMIFRSCRFVPLSGLLSFEYNIIVASQR